MTDVTVLIPVWNRPDRAAAVAATIDATSDARVLFIAASDDKRQLRAVRKVMRTYPRVGLTIVDPPSGQPGDYARKINRGVLAAGGDWFFQGADDLHFHPGWLAEALDVHDQTGARVIGTNDLCNPRTRSRHSTHSLVHRTFIEVGAVYDRPGHMLHEGYWHNYVDDELIAAARLHRTFAHAPRAHVEHLHPNCGRADMDATYDRALDRRHFSRDRQLLNYRVRHMKRRRPVPRRPPATG